MQGTGTVWQDFTTIPEFWARIGPSVLAYEQKFRRLCTDPRVAELRADTDEGRRAMAGLNGWNWAGFLFGPFWAIWRGVRYGWIWLVATLVTSVAAELNPSHLTEAVSLVAALGAMFVYGLRGNALLLVRLAETIDRPVAEARPSMLRLLGAFAAIAGALAVVIAVAIAQS